MFELVMSGNVFDKRWFSWCGFFGVGIVSGFVLVVCVLKFMVFGVVGMIVVIDVVEVVWLYSG